MASMIQGYHSVSLTKMTSPSGLLQNAVQCFLVAETKEAIKK